MSNISFHFNCVSFPFYTLSLIFLLNSVTFVRSFYYSQLPYNRHFTYETPQQTFQYAIPSPIKLQDNQGSAWTSLSMVNSTVGSNQDLQNNPTFQKNVYLSYPPMPPPPRRRRRLFPYFLLGFATGSAAVIGGAAVAGAFRG